jgi:hypothetical protein
MNIKQTYFLPVFASVVLLMSSALTSCLGDSNSNEVIVTNYSNATVKTFSFNSNDSVCTGLASYAFTIDHYGASDPALIAKWPGAGIIFNSDSLPVGSVPDTIEVEMTYSSPSAVMFYHYDASANLVDSVDFTEKQKVNFSPYATTVLRLTAYDKQTTKDYIIKVNVHKTVGDTIRWGMLSENLFPGLGDVIALRVDTIGNTFYALAATADSSVWYSECEMNYPLDAWTDPVRVGTMQTLNPATLWSWNSRLCCVGLDGELRYSTDGQNWNRVLNPGALKFCNLLGLQFKAYGAASDSIRAITFGEDGRYYFAAATGIDEPWTVGDEVPDGFPLVGYTRPISMPAVPQRGNRTSRIYITGGLTYAGKCTSSTWCCDGTEWAEFVQNSLPVMHDAAVIPYCTDTDEPGTLWLMSPGSGMDGILYFSEDKGVTWKTLAKEYASYADVDNMGLDVCPSMYFDPNDYRIYIFELDSDRCVRLVSGQLTKLTFQHRR